jgi:integrase
LGYSDLTTLFFKPMASATFVLKEPKADKPTLIFLIIREGGQRLKYSTGENIHPAKWDAENNKANTRLKLSEAEKAINTQLGRYLAAFDMLKAGAMLEGKPLDFEKVRNHLNKEFTNRPQPKADTFLGFARGLKIDLNRKAQTKKNYQTAINTVEAYETKRRKGKPLRFEDITLDFYTDFIQFCEGEGFTINTTGSHLKNIKVFADAAYERGLHQNTDYKRKGFKVLAEDVENVYLTEAELSAIYATDLSKSPKLDRVRDLFLVACRTGLRFSDLRTLTPEKIIQTDSGEIIQLQTQKTGQVVYIPLHQQTREILNKYRYNLPRVLSNQKFNEYVKEVVKAAGINTPTTLTKTKGGERTEAILPKYQLVTVHTARRTFATLAYKAGLPAQSIMKITGHRTERSFQAYIKLTNREHAELMAKHDFFKPQLLIAN